MMAKTKCPKCGYTGSDGRAHDRETYYEVCLVCAPRSSSTTMAALKRPSPKDPAAVREGST